MSSERNSSLKDVMKRAEEEDVMVYAIGLAGCERLRPAVRRLRRPAEQSAAGGVQRVWRRTWHMARRRAIAARQPDRPDEGAAEDCECHRRRLFRAGVEPSDLASTFARVAEELHHQYALGFTPTKLDGKMHTLEVRVAQSGLTARARRSYLATAPRS